MIDLQPFLSETLKQDSWRHQVWNIDKMYTRRNMCIKIKKGQHMWDKDKEKHISYIYIYIKEYNVRKSGHKIMVHKVRKDTSKLHYIPQITLPLVTLILW